MTKVELSEATLHFAEYAEKVKTGETILLCEQGIPFAEIRLVFHSTSADPKVGLYEGKIRLDSESDRADEQILEDFGSSEIFPKG